MKTISARADVRDTAYYLILNEDDLFHRKLLQKGIKYVLSLSLNDERGNLGFINFSTINDEGISEEQKKFLTDVSNLVSLSISNIRLKNKLQIQSETIKNKNRELQEYIYTISHDLKTPLFSILGFVNILKEDYGDKFEPQVIKYLDRLAYNTKKMDEMVKSLLTLSKIGTYKFTVERINTREFFRNIKKSLELKIKQRDAKFVMNIENLDINSDVFLLTHVIENLIDNGLKYVPSDKRPELYVECLRGSRDDKRVLKIKIRDNGIGIPNDSFEKIFTVFSRLNKLKNVEGSGTGLTIVRRMVEKLNGKIWLESEVGSGTTFYLELPIKK